MPRQFILSRLFWFITWTISLIIWHSGRWDFMNDSGNSINSFSQWIEKRREKNLHKVKQLKACGRPSNTNKLPLVWTFYCQWFEYLKNLNTLALWSLAVFLLWSQFKCQGSLSSIADNSIFYNNPHLHRALICPAYSGPGVCIVSLTFRSSFAQASGSKSPFANCTIVQIWEQRRPKSRLESLRFIRLLMGHVNIPRTGSSVYSNRRACQIRFHFAHILLIKISRWFLLILSTDNRCHCPAESSSCGVVSQMSEVDVVFTIFFVELSPIPSIGLRVIKLIVSQSSCLDEENLDKTAPLKMILNFYFVSIGLQVKNVAQCRPRLRSGLAWPE